MDIQKKLDLLGAGAQSEVVSGVCGETQPRVRDEIGRWIYPAVRSDGHPIKLLKILQTNVCERDCYYCATRRGRDCERTTFKPDELAQTFDQLHRARIAEGIFLSSAVAGGGTRTMERILATADLLRKKFEFRGYMHLKLMPGAETAAIEHALRLADRVSVNLEAPTPEILARLSPSKHLAKELIAPLEIARRLIDNDPAMSKKTVTTQFVVGAVGESDRDLARRTFQLYRELRLARVYYSAFRPVLGTPLENQAPTPLIRENRLYQSDFLLRQYGFTFEDLIFDQSGNLPTNLDPKTVWATHHPELFPIEINQADQQDLLRIPGIGPLSARRILQLRRVHRFSSVEQLDRTGADAKRAAPFILLNGAAPTRQLPLL